MERIDWEDGRPRSARFGDVYFQADGLAESRAVFLTGCGLPEAWTGRRRFVVAELGFGTGLNVLALLQLWAAARPGPQARLSIFSVEAFPMARDEAARALATWPELSALAAPLLAQWPRGRSGRHRVAWPSLGATLEIAVDEALAAVRGWDGAADAWFLDGFAPSSNPEMWGAELLAEVAARTAPAGRLATFTVAGAVRRALAGTGLAVSKHPGFGRKRERLEARAPGPLRPERPLPTVAVVGGGIAAAALLRAFRAQDVEAVRVDAAVTSASANPAALVSPRLDAGLGAAARLHAEAFARAVQLYAGEAPDAVLARGALQLALRPQDGDRFARISGWAGFAPETLRVLEPEDVAARLDEPAGPIALLMEEALVVEPSAVLARWLGEGEPVRGRAAAIVADADGRLSVRSDEGRDLARCDAVVLACGADLARLRPELTLRPTRGQVTTSARAFTGAPAAWGGYALPTRGGLLFGATHDRGDADAGVRAGDDAANLRALAQGRPRLAAALDAATLEGRAAVRLSRPDHLPLAGALGGGQWVLGALGGRGFTLAPLLAEHVVAGVLGAASPLPADLAELVAPRRRRNGG